MTGLDKIKDKIIAEAQLDAARMIEDAQKKCNEIILRASGDADNIKAELDVAAHREAESLISRAKSGAALEKRNIIAQAKSHATDLAFETAKKEILSLPDEQYIEFLAKLLVSALSSQLDIEKTNRELYGEESNEAPVDVLLSQEDIMRAGTKIIPAAKKMAAGKPVSHLLERAGVSVETAKIEGGMIIRIGDLDINCSVEALIESAKERLEGDVARILFG
ncbi:MAG: hypothetical protein IJC32_02925 [Clostridia bacterium]|nr:hypothetical protein [Clostridia bacterium]MBQ4327349.1 hypothetical protein [Clostridia bacterium]